MYFNAVPHPLGLDGHRDMKGGRVDTASDRVSVAQVIRKQPVLAFANLQITEELLSATHRKLLVEIVAQVIVIDRNGDLVFLPFVFDDAPLDLPSTS